MPDWDFWKNKHFFFQIENIMESFKKLEDHSESPIEKLAGLSMGRLMAWFGKYNITFKQQAVVDKYRVDFLITYHPIHGEDHKIIVECDGHDFHEKTKEQAKKDKERDRYFTKNGYKILRYSGSELCEEPLKVFLDVSEIICPNRFQAIFLKEGEQDGPKTND